MITMLKKNVDYRKLSYVDDNRAVYKIVIVDTKAWYDIKVPNSNFISMFDFHELLGVFRNSKLSEKEFIIKSDYIFIPTQKALCMNPRDVKGIINCIHYAALDILGRFKLGNLDLMMHEHALCIRNRCVWKEFITEINNDYPRLNYRYRITLIKTTLAFQPECKEIMHEYAFYRTKNPFFTIEDDKNPIVKSNIMD